MQCPGNICYDIAEHNCVQFKDTREYHRVHGGQGGGGGGLGGRSLLLKNNKAIGFHSNTGLDPLENHTVSLMSSQIVSNHFPTLSTTYNR